jgi:chromosomal replication initiation ATPase DnaA
MIDDINEFSRYIENTYGTRIKVNRFVDESVTRDTQAVDIWATAISEYFGCAKDKLFSRGRRNNSTEKVWLQYFLMEKEMLSPVKIYNMFGLRDHTTLYSNRASCQGYSEVYPEINNGIVDIHNRLIKELGLDKQIKII